MLKTLKNIMNFNEEKNKSLPKTKPSYTGNSVEKVEIMKLLNEFYDVEMRAMNINKSLFKLK